MGLSQKTCNKVGWGSLFYFRLADKYQIAILVLDIQTPFDLHEHSLKRMRRPLDLSETTAKASCKPWNLLSERLKSVSLFIYMTPMCRERGRGAAVVMEFVVAMARNVSLWAITAKSFKISGFGGQSWEITSSETCENLKLPQVVTDVIADYIQNCSEL